ncbi:lipopolysaccharide assembly protein LapA domain-containing protein [Rosenbergiella epipactidis]|uniref:LapA family protein n=1 Tax=Rosenbergiella epipactidis TaxID=1544694 RepID=UPI001F4D62DE|nr:lipopolysaccharide assembly protein LapA domain-containing protein [Rosenbergiella epipactidis]
MKFKYLLLFIVVLFIFIVSFTLGAKNEQLVTFNFLVAEGAFRLSTLLASLFGIGFLLGWAICGLFWLRARVALAHAKNKVIKLEQQLSKQP